MWNLKKIGIDDLDCKAEIETQNIEQRINTRGKG